MAGTDRPGKSPMWCCDRMVYQGHAWRLAVPALARLRHDANLMPFETAIDLVKEHRTSADCGREELA